VARVALATGLGPRGFPWATLTVNLLGCLAIGAGFALFETLASDSARAWRLPLMGGLLGGFTTFSAFTFEKHAFLKNGDLANLAIYAIGSIVLGIAAVFIGLSLTK